jgi:hypothetical protein
MLPKQNVYDLSFSFNSLNLYPIEAYVSHFRINQSVLGSVKCCFLTDPKEKLLDF